MRNNQLELVGNIDSDLVANSDLHSDILLDCIEDEEIKMNTCMHQTEKVGKLYSTPDDPLLLKLECIKCGELYHPDFKNKYLLAENMSNE